MKIAMTGVFVDEPNKAIDFYAEVLGFEVKEHRSEMQLAVVGPKNDPRGTVLLLEPNATEYSQVSHPAHKNRMGLSGRF